MKKKSESVNAGKMQKKSTKFQPGKSGNPAGKKPGTRNKVTMAVIELLNGQAEKLTQRCVERALEGDLQALKICLDRIVPVVKERSVRVPLPDTSTAENIEKAFDAVLLAISTGQLTPSEGATMTNILKERRSALELREFDQRLTMLEDKVKKGG